MALKIGEAVQQLLTQGLDAAAQVKLAELRVNDPTGYVTGPNGQRVQVGQQAGGLGGALAGVPPVVWLGLVVVIGVVVVVPLLKR
jgi:hypothetical protein